MNIAEQLTGLQEFWVRLGSEDMTERVKQLEIDGLTYTSQKLAASVGLDLMPRLSAVIGAALLRAIASGEEADQGFGVSSILAVAEQARMDPFGPIARDLMARMQCSNVDRSGRAGSLNSQSAFDEHFAGEYLHLLRVCIFAIAHNFRGPTLGVR